MTQVIVSGLSQGVIYALVALGFAMIYRSTRVINLAQGDVVVLCGFLAYSLYASPLHLPYALVVILVCLAGGLTMLIPELVALRFAYRYSTTDALIATIGLSSVIYNIEQLGWNKTGESFPSVFGNHGVTVAGARIAGDTIAIFVAGAAAMACLGFFLTRMRAGIAMRAVACQPFAARLVGIDTKVMVSASFFIAGTVGGLAGVLIAPTAFLTSSTGALLSLNGFVAATIGGLGKVPGAIVGGLILGLSQSVATNYLPNPNYGSVAGWALLVLVLLFRPWGIFGEEGAEQASI